ncbi:MAG: NAD-dependent epimerase/dehydratase family protein [Phycisphaerae bacterium]
MMAFVTGAGGCVGRQLVQRLLEQGWRVTGLLLPSEADSFPFKDDLRVRRVIGEINSLPGDAIAPGDTVFHLAAQVHTVPKTEVQRQKFFQVNRDGTARVAQAASGSGAAGFVFVSTVAVYGHRQEREPCPEDAPAEPETPYGRSKLEGESKVREILGGRVPFVIARPVVVYGPGDRGNFVKLVGAVRKGRLPAIDGGRARKKILYVKNLAATLAFLGANAAEFDGLVVNVADSETLTLREIATAVARTLGVDLRIINLPLWLIRPMALLGDLAGWALRREMPLSTRRLRVVTSDTLIDTSRLEGILKDRLALRPFEECLKDYLGRTFSSSGRVNEKR